MFHMLTCSLWLLVSQWNWRVNLWTYFLIQATVYLENQWSYITISTDSEINHLNPTFPCLAQTGFCVWYPAFTPFEHSDVTLATTYVVHKHIRFAFIWVKEIFLTAEYNIYLSLKNLKQPIFLKNYSALINHDASFSDLFRTWVCRN